TTLQVVTNFGWMIPYIACMIVATGLLAHFSLTLVRFLRRREEGQAAMLRSRAQIAAAKPGVILPAIVVLLAACFLGYLAMIPTTGAKEIDLYNFGKLPVMSGGRVEPMDSLARNALRILCLREAYLDQSGIQLKAAKDGSIEVEAVIPGSAAAIAGIQ